MFWASGRKTLPPRMGRHGHHGHHDQKAVHPRVKPVSLNPNWPRVFWGQSLGSGPGPRVTRLSSRSSPGRPGRVPEGLNPGSGGSITWTPVLSFRYRPRSRVVCEHLCHLPPTAQQITPTWGAWSSLLPGSEGWDLGARVCQQGVSRAGAAISRAPLSWI